MKSLIFDVHRGTTHDGPGMRTTIFTKGCSLKCAWCHNPESIDFRPQVEWNEQKCIHCQICQKKYAQLESVNTSTYTPMDIIRCENAIEYATHCPSKALRVIGEYKSMDELLEIATKDLIYFEMFSGGVTFSGGEPLMQVEMLEKLLPILKEKGINTAIDTCGNVPYSAFKRVLPYVDNFLYDVKILDSERHRHFTGADNQLILNNLKLLSYDLSPNQNLWIRTPLIPHATASIQNIRDICVFIKDLPRLERYELCAFNNVCKDKYRKLNLDWPYKKTELMTQEEADSYFEIAKSYMNDKAVLSGLTANSSAH